MATRAYQPTSDPLISVVIPAHNRAAVLGRALASALQQTHGSLEVIVVDDSSSDGTADVAQEYADRDFRVRLIRKPTHAGAQAARNTGITHAKGAWVAFLDSDDYLLPRSLELRLSLAAQLGLQVVHSECCILESDDDPECRRFGTPPLAGGVYAQLLERPGPTFPGLLVAREALAQIGPLDERIVSYQEWDTSILLARHNEFGFVDEPTFVYDCRHAGTISKDPLRAATGYEQVVSKHREEIMRCLGRKGLAVHCRNLASQFGGAGAYGTALKYLLKAFLQSPSSLKGLAGTSRTIWRSRRAPGVSR